MIKFIVFFNDELVKTYELDEITVTIGRLPENAICISNMGISRRHAKIERDTNSSYTISDLNSLNGTFLNNAKVKKAILSNGDKILIGKYTILFENLENKNADAAQQKKDDTTITSSSFIEEMMPQEGSTREQTAISTSTGTANANAVLIEINKHVIYKLDKPLVTLGDSENDDVFVSGFLVDEGHVFIERTGPDLWIKSQKLLGQFKVNGKKTKNRKLQHKDRIEIGFSTFRYMENG